MGARPKHYLDLWSRIWSLLPGLGYLVWPGHREQDGSQGISIKQEVLNPACHMLRVALGSLSASNQASFHPVVQYLSRVWLFVTLWTATRHVLHLPCPWPSPRVCSYSCPLSRWCHPTISSSVVPFSSCLQSFPASESFLMSRLFASVCQSIGVSASASVLPMNIQGWV